MTTHLYILSPYLKYSLAKVRHNILIMVLLLDVNPEVGAHVQSELGILFWCNFFLGVVILKFLPIKKCLLSRVRNVFLITI